MYVLLFHRVLYTLMCWSSRVTKFGKWLRTRSMTNMVFCFSTLISRFISKIATEQHKSCTDVFFIIVHFIFTHKGALLQSCSVFLYNNIMFEALQQRGGRPCTSITDGKTTSCGHEMRLTPFRDKRTQEADSITLVSWRRGSVEARYASWQQGRGDLGGVLVKWQIRLSVESLDFYWISGYCRRDWISFTEPAWSRYHQPPTGSSTTQITLSF